MVVFACVVFVGVFVSVFAGAFVFVDLVGVVGLDVCAGVCRAFFLNRCRCSSFNCLSSCMFLVVVGGVARDCFWCLGVRGCGVVVIGVGMCV